MFASRYQSALSRFWLQARGIIDADEASVPLVPASALRRAA